MNKQVLRILEMNKQVYRILEIHIYGIFILKIISKYLPVG